MSLSHLREERLLHPTICRPLPLLRILEFFDGVIAQLVERYNGIVEVRGSNPRGSTEKGRDQPKQAEIGLFSFTGIAVDKSPTELLNATPTTGPGCGLADVHRRQIDRYDGPP
jgi:hypothetical protein